MERMTARAFRAGFAKITEPVLVGDGIWFPDASQVLMKDDIGRMRDDYVVKEMSDGELSIIVAKEHPQPRFPEPGVRVQDEPEIVAPKLPPAKGRRMPRPRVDELTGEILAMTPEVYAHPKKEILFPNLGGKVPYKPVTKPVEKKKR